MPADGLGVVIVLQKLLHDITESRPQRSSIRLASLWERITESG